MSRGFDGPEIDDFHRPQRDVNRSPESNRRAGWDAVRRLERIRGEEERADQRDQEARGAAGGNRPPLPREERVQLVLARTSRTNYVDRNRTYQLRDSEMHALTEVGKFRVVATSDLVQFAYNGDSSRMQNDRLTHYILGFVFLMRKAWCQKRPTPATMHATERIRSRLSAPLLDAALCA